MIKWIIIIVIGLFILGLLGNGIDELGKILKSLFSISKKTIGMFVFLLLIVYLYIGGENPNNRIYSDLSEEEISNYDPHFQCSMLIVDCKEKTYTTKSLKDGKIYTHVQKMKDAVKVDLMNKYSRIVLKNPKCDEFEVDTFYMGEIRFRDRTTYVDNKRDGKIFEYR
jgi:hypothetical protein